MAKNQRQILRVEGTAPDFDATTTKGDINFYDYIGAQWCLLFSHSDDFTPICTTELGRFAQLQPEFAKRNTKLLGLVGTFPFDHIVPSGLFTPTTMIADREWILYKSANDLESHKIWIQDINQCFNCELNFPIIADPERAVAAVYDMLDYQDKTNVDLSGDRMTIRSTFLIDHTKRIRLILTYPSTTGRNIPEILRSIDALRMTDKHDIITPIDWKQGDPIIIPPYLTNAEATERFGPYDEVTLYLRYTRV